MKRYKLQAICCVFGMLLAACSGHPAAAKKDTAIGTPLVRKDTTTKDTGANALGIDHNTVGGTDLQVDSGAAKPLK